MSLLTKLLSFTLLPPTLFILAFLVIGIKAGKDRFVRYFSYTCALLLYLLSTEPVKDLLYRPLEGKHYVPSSFSADALVVLGGGAYNTGILKEDSMKRLLTAFVLHKKTGLPLILSGGASLGSLPEAEVMKSLLEELGVDKGKVLLEVKSTSTMENALYVKEICEKKGYKEVVLITSAYHMPRAVQAFQKVGLDVVPYPTDFKQDKKYNLYSLLPKMGTLNDSYKALREYLALLFYHLVY